MGAVNGLYAGGGGGGCGNGRNDFSANNGLIQEDGEILLPKLDPTFS